MISKHLQRSYKDFHQGEATTPLLAPTDVYWGGVGCVIGQKHMVTCWLLMVLSQIIIKLLVLPFPRRFQEKLYGRLADFLVQLYMTFFSRSNYDNNEMYHCLAHDVVTWDEDRNASTVTVNSVDLIV